MTVRVLHINARWGAGKGGIKSFIGTLLEGCPDEISQSVLSVGAIAGEAPAVGIYGPIVDSASASKITFADKELTAFLKEHPFDVVHIHTNNALAFLFADCAKRAGVPMRIVHSHTSMLESKELPKVLMNKYLFTRYHGSCTDRWACSEGAGKHIFGNESFVKVNNAVNEARFAFSSETRVRMRNELGIADSELAIVHVGAGIYAKNTEMTLRILRALLDSGRSARLLLLGEGKHSSEVKALAHELALEDHILFAGFQNAPEDFYCTSDVMLAPSRYEGLPICVVEAQANALPVMLSDNVSTESALTELVNYLSLESSEDVWADELVRICARRKEYVERSEIYAHQLREKGFTTDKLCEFVTGEYLRAIQGSDAK